MIPKKHRLTTRVGEDFFANAKRAYSPLFVLYFQKKEDSELAEATVIVPKKHASKATERSKIKRKMKEVLKPLLPSLSGFRVILYLKKPVKDFVNFEKEVGHLINKIK
jgi:ribonuclease P protein component